MRHRVRVVGRTEDRWLADAKAMHLELAGVEATARRAREIAALPTVVWKGRTLYTLRCDADFGRGPHLMNVPESVLWSLIHLSRYRCAWHR